MTEADSRALPLEKRSAIAQEMADVFLYLLQLSDHLGVDLIEVAKTKIAANAEKYPIALAKGTSRKYTDF